MLPLQTLFAGCVGKHPLPGFCIDDFPLLGRRIETDMRRSRDFEPSENVKINRLRIEAVDVSDGIESQSGFHDSPPPIFCWAC